MNLTPQLGKVINHKYRLIDILGEGGWGVTFLAEDIPHKQKVALKALTIKGLSDWKQVELFEREAEVLQGLDHAAIPSYLEYFTIDTPENRYFYLVQELASGKSLAEWVQEGWRASETEVKEIAAQLLEILIYLYTQEPPIIHRDIKPSNIIRQEDGKIFLVDFGAVKNTYYSTLARSSTIVGTYGYIAPEQFIGKAQPASDLYGLGATILFLLTHISPTELSTDDLRIDFRHRVNMSNDFADWLEIMLEPEIENRFSNAQEALAVLKGKQKNPLQIDYFRSKITIKQAVIIILGLLLLGNSYKWALLSRIGIVPEDICSPQVMTKYLKQGGNPNAERNSFAESYPIVMCFAEVKSRKILELYIEKGGDIYHNHYGDTVWKKVYSPQSALILFQYFRNDNNLSKKKRQQITLELLSKSKEITLLLMKNGADINTRDEDGNTLLHKTRDPKLAIFAINQGIDVNEQNYKGQTPLHLASNESTAQILINLGGSLNVRDNRGNTPLLSMFDSSLFSSEQASIVDLFIKYGANINNNNIKGETPLHLLIINKSSIYSVKTLLKHGIDINIKDNQDKTPLDYAKISDNQEIINLLNSYNN